MVMGSCVYHVGHQGLRQMLNAIGQNAEMETYTQALYEAREIAQTRMQQEAQQAQAEGIIGARIVEFSHGWGSHIIEFFAVGTSITAIEGAHNVQAPVMSVNLSQ